MAGAGIFVVRHAQSEGNGGGRTDNAAVTPITEMGARQAECVADLIAERPAAIVVSSFLRTVQSAEPLRRRWERCDPLWVDGEGCECFADFVARVRRLERRLGAREVGETVVVFTHRLVMQALLWLQRNGHERTGGTEMADFRRFHRGVSVPNCGVLRASPDGNGRVRLPANVSAAHLPRHLWSE